MLLPENIINASNNLVGNEKTLTEGLSRFPGPSCRFVAPVRTRDGLLLLQWSRRFAGLAATTQGGDP